MKAYIDRIIVEHIDVDSTENVGTNLPKKLKKVKIISAGDSPNGNSNKHLEGKEVLLEGMANGIPLKLDKDNVVYLYKRTSIEVIL